jgi:hypothetical protein
MKVPSAAIVLSGYCGEVGQLGISGSRKLGRLVGGVEVDSPRGGVSGPEAGGAHLWH